MELGRRRLRGQSGGDGGGCDDGDDPQPPKLLNGGKPPSGGGGCGGGEDRKIRRRSSTYPLDSRQKIYSRQFSFEKSWKIPCHYYGIIVLLFYAIIVLVVITIFNAVFLSKLKYLACTIANTWNLSFPMC